jgi:hypothetical protein
VSAQNSLRIRIGDIPQPMSIDARLGELKRELAQQLSSSRTKRRGEQAVNVKQVAARTL